MSLLAKLVLALLLASALLILGYAGFMTQIRNPRMIEQLRGEGASEAGKRVMLLTLPDGRTLPVNYLREGSAVYAGADGPWWRELRDAGARVSLRIQGETLNGHARAVRDDPQLTREVFSRLRPDVPAWLPDWLNGVLVIVSLDGAADG
jgi:hypothetical protein